VSWEGKKVCEEVGGGEGLGEGMYFEIPELSASRMVRSAGLRCTVARDEERSVNDNNDILQRKTDCVFLRESR
jgi:hypothetical protein